MSEWTDARTDACESPFWDRNVTLGRVKDGIVRFAKNTTDKVKILAQAEADMDAGAVYLLAWTGKYTTDLFAVTREDIRRWTLEREQRSG